MTTASAAHGPLSVVDVEASGLHGYPVELGVATWDRAAGTVATWSTLVRPAREWVEDPEGWWDPAAEAMHGISRRDLDAGARPAEALAGLRDALGGRVAHRDGGGFDAEWLRLLVETAGGGPPVPQGTLRDLGRAAGLGDEGVATMAMALEAGDAAAAHRAADDALRTVLALALACGEREPRVVGRRGREAGAAGAPG